MIAFDTEALPPSRSRARRSRSGPRAGGVEGERSSAVGDPLVGASRSCRRCSQPSLGRGRAAGSRRARRRARHRQVATGRRVEQPAGGPPHLRRMRRVRVGDGVLPFRAQLREVLGIAATPATTRSRMPLVAAVPDRDAPALARMAAPARRRPGRVGSGDRDDASVGPPVPQGAVAGGAHGVPRRGPSGAGRDLRRQRPIHGRGVRGGARPLGSAPPTSGPGSCSSCSGIAPPGGDSEPTMWLSESRSAHCRLRPQRPWSRSRLANSRCPRTSLTWWSSGLTAARCSCWAWSGRPWRRTAGRTAQLGRRLAASQIDQLAPADAPSCGTRPFSLSPSARPNSAECWPMKHYLRGVRRCVGLATTFIRRDMAGGGLPRPSSETWPMRGCPIADAGCSMAERPIFGARVG